MKKWLKGTNAAVISIAVLGIFILLTIFLHSMKGVQWDLTASKKFTLSEQTLTTLKNLDQDIHAIAFTDAGQGEVSRQISDLLDEYHKRNGKFTWEDVDPEKNPILARQYGITSYGSIIFKSGDKTKSIDSSAIFGRGADQTTYTFSGEAQFTQAILHLTSMEKQIGYVITGHGEMGPGDASAFTSSLESEGFEINSLNLYKEGVVPKDADLLIVLSPQSDISKKEADLIQAFAKDKGKLFLTLDITKDMDQWANWNSILASVGIQSESALVVETAQTLSNDPLTIIPTYGHHEITDKLSSGSRIVVLPGAIALSPASGDTDLSATALLETSDKGYAKKSLDRLTSGETLTMSDLEKTDADIAGPVQMAYAIADSSNVPKAVIVGNGTFLSDQWFGEQANKDFALSSVGWLAGQEELVSIRPREENAPQQVYISGRETNLIFYGTVVAFPLLFLLTGGVIWWRRRKG